MPRRIANSTLNASTIDILNVIRTNASLEYQELVPQVETVHDIPKVGEVLYGYPAMANQFINALINRIALVRVKSATFNNPYAILKKGYIEYGESVEEVFVNIAKVREYSQEKAAAREFARTLPDVKGAFHVMNWRVQYPITIQDEDLKQAFLSMDGVQELIGRIVDSVYRAAEYDEFLLFKYMIIKGYNEGCFHREYFTPTKFSDSAVAFRSLSNLLTFMSTNYNEAGVLNVTPRERQAIFMDAEYNARFDVDVLASAFNMGKADFMGRLFLIDSFQTFNNERFAEIQNNTDMMPPVTPDELANMANVKAILIDTEWFQVYDNHNRFTEKYVAAGERWNYFYNVWKTISHSPYANAVAIIEGAQQPLPTTISFQVSSVDRSDVATVINLLPSSAMPQNYAFVQTDDMVRETIAAHPYGSIIIPNGATAQKLVVNLGGQTYVTAAPVGSTTSVGTTLTFTPAAGASLDDCPLDAPCEPLTTPPTKTAKTAAKTTAK